MPNPTPPRPPANPVPMTRRGPDGRPYISEEVEQRAADAQRADRERPKPLPLGNTTAPD